MLSPGHCHAAVIGFLLPGLAYVLYCRVVRGGIMHALVTWTEFKLTSDADQWLVCTLHLVLPCPTLPCLPLPCLEQLLLCECTQQYIVPCRVCGHTCVHMQRSEVAAVY